MISIFNAGHCGDRSPRKGGDWKKNGETKAEKAFERVGNFSWKWHFKTFPKWPIGFSQDGYFDFSIMSFFRNSDFNVSLVQLGLSCVQVVNCYFGRMFGIIFWIVLVLFFCIIFGLSSGISSGMFVPLAFSFAQFSSSHFLFWFFPRQTDSLIHC